MNTSIAIKTQAALTKAEEVDKLISSIQSDLDEMKAVIEENIPSKVNTDWSNELLANWRKNYDNEVKEALAQMALSATNIRAAVKAAETFTQSVQ